MTSAAIYARVSSARQKRDETIASQTAALRGHAGQLGVELPEEWVSEDEGHSGATLVRPALERLRDVVAGVGVDVLLCYTGPAGPQVRLPGPADRGVRPRRLLLQGLTLWRRLIPRVCAAQRLMIGRYRVQQVWCKWLVGFSPVGVGCVDAGHEYAVGGAGGGEVLVAFGEL
jgi:Resolvase, N terminal domain